MKHDKNIFALFDFGEIFEMTSLLITNIRNYSEYTQLSWFLCLTMNILGTRISLKATSENVLSFIVVIF